MPQNITDSPVFTDPVTAPADGDPLDAASIIVNGIQALSNRTKYLADLVGGNAGTDEWFYEDAARVRQRIVSPFAMTEGTLATAGTQYWTVANFVSGGTAYSRTSQVDRALLVDDISRYMPIGAQLTRIEALVGPGSARATVGDRMTMTLARQTPNFATPAIPVAVGPIFTATDDGTSAVQVIDSGVILQLVDRTSDLVLRIAAGNDAGTNKDDVHAIRFSFNVLGPNAF